MNTPPPPETSVIANMGNDTDPQAPAALPQHGGHRTPGPGKRLGRPPKKAKEKAVTVAIVLSCPKAAKHLKARAKRRRMTPGAMIEHDLNLSQP